MLSIDISFLLLLAIAYIAPTHSFAPCPTSSPSTSLRSLNDDRSTPSQHSNEERKIRTAYFLHSSGFQPSRSIISTFLDGKDGDVTDSKEDSQLHMAELEQSYRQSLLSRISINEDDAKVSIDQEHVDYVSNLVDEWNAEWQFRVSANHAAKEKARAKQQERLETFLAMIRQKSGEEQASDGSRGSSGDRRDDADGRPRFGMPFGEKKGKTAAKKETGLDAAKDSSVASVEDDVKSDASILNQFKQEKETALNEQAVPPIGDAYSTESSSAQNESTTSNRKSEVVTETSDETAESQNPSGVSHNETSLIEIDKNFNSTSNQELTNKTSAKDPNLQHNNEDMDQAELRAANAKAAQEKADERLKQKIESETKKKEEAKAKAEAILKHAEEEERLRIEREQAEAIEEQRIREEEEERVKAEEERLRIEKEQAEEAARLKAQQEEADRLQREEEAARLQREEGEEAARLKAQEEEQEKLRAEAIQQRIDLVESKMQSLTDKATGVTFPPKLDEGLYLVGVGVRKKAIINVYSVAMYSSPSVLEAISVFPQGKQKKEAKVALRDAARSFDSSSPLTSFVLEFTLKADGKAIAGAIAESVRPRFAGAEANLNELESLIFEGVSKKGYQATKGTVFRFDCSAEGVGVSVDGEEQGEVRSESLGSAFVDVFMDDKAVSPRLVDSCIETWSGSGL